MSEVKITVKPNGPYRVEGPIKLVDAEGKEWDLTGKPAISLCRCGGSSNKTFFDGQHSKIGFPGAESAGAEAGQKQGSQVGSPSPGSPFGGTLPLPLPQSS